MSDPDKTGKFQTITRSVPRDYVDEGVSHLRHALKRHASASSIREALERLLEELNQRENAA